jgi:hypothetical protein
MTDAALLIRSSPASFLQQESRKRKCRCRAGRQEERKSLTRKPRIWDARQGFLFEGENAEKRREE